MLTQDIELGSHYKVRGHPGYNERTVGELFRNDRNFCISIMNDKGNDFDEFIKESITIVAIDTYKRWKETTQPSEPDYNVPFILNNGRHKGENIRDVYARNTKFCIKLYNSAPYYSNKYLEYFQTQCWISFLNSERFGNTTPRFAVKVLPKTTQMVTQNTPAPKHLKHNVGVPRHVLQKPKRDDSKLNGLETQILGEFNAGSSIDKISTDFKLKISSIERIFCKCISLDKLELRDFGINDVQYARVSEAVNVGEQIKLIELIPIINTGDDDLTVDQIKYCIAKVKKAYGKKEAETEPEHESEQTEQVGRED